MWVFYIYIPEKLDLLYTHMIRLNLPCVLNMEGQSKYSLPKSHDCRINAYFIFYKTEVQHTFL
jgi:hypothetical protein